MSTKDNFLLYNYILGQENGIVVMSHQQKSIVEKLS